MLTASNLESPTLAIQHVSSKIKQARAHDPLLLLILGFFLSLSSIYDRLIFKASVGG